MHVWRAHTGSRAPGMRSGALHFVSSRFASFCFVAGLGVSGRYEWMKRGGAPIPGTPPPPPPHSITPPIPHSVMGCSSRFVPFRSDWTRWGPTRPDSFRPVLSCSAFVVVASEGVEWSSVLRCLCKGGGEVMT